MRGATLLAIAGGLTLAGCSSGQGDDAAVPAAASSPAAVVETATATPVPTGTGAAPTAEAVPEAPVDPAFDFAATTVEGAAFEGASIANSDVILWFWAPWCPTCVAEAPVILDAAGRLPAGVEVVGMAGLSGDQEYMQEFVSTTGTGSLTHVADLDGGIWRGFDVATQATIVVIDDSGERTTLGAGTTADELVEHAQRIAAT